MFRKNNVESKMGEPINIDVGLEGVFKFKGPVNLKISGKFDGELEAKGRLIIGEKADIKAKIIKVDTLVIAGRVKGDIVCSKRLDLYSTARVIGNVETPLLITQEGAMLKGSCLMPVDEERADRKESHSKKKEEG